MTTPPPPPLAGSSSRRPSGPLTTPPRPPAIPRSSSVSASIDFFESKSRSSTPPPPATFKVTVPVPQQRKDETGSGTGKRTPGSPKPVGPRTMSPPSREGRRLSYRPPSEVDGMVRRSMEDPRRGLGLGIDVDAGGRRRGSEGGLSAGLSRIRPRSARPIDRDGVNGGGGERSVSEAAVAETSRRPVLRPRQPSAQATKPAIRVVQPTPSSSARRRTSAPPESPITPTHTRALSPAGASSSSSADLSSSSRSIRPGSRRTSYQLANSSEIKRSSVTSEFGVLGATRQSPRLGRFVESFDDTDVVVPTALAARGSSDKGKSPEIPTNTGTPLLDTSPFVIQRENGTTVGGRDIDTLSDSSSFATSAASSSYVSAKSPSSPPTRSRPKIPHRTTSSINSPPAVSPRTSSIDGYSPSSPSTKTNGFDPGHILRVTSRESNASGQSADSTETRVRRASEATTRARQSIELGRAIPIPSSSTTADPATPPSVTPNTPDPPPSTSPRPTRKSPGLTINPPPPRPPRDIARPSPPIPVKSPLRRLTPQHPSLPDLREGRSPRHRDGSGESALATGSSMTESFETAPLAPDEADEMVLQPGDTIPYPASYDSNHTHEEIRFTMLTVPSVYSQDSAPSTVRTVPESDFGSGSGGPTTGGSGSFGWGRQRHSIMSTDSGWEDSISRSASLPRLRISSSDTGKSLPETPRETPSTANTSSSASHDVADGHSPLTPSRSPSMPVMNSANETPRQQTLAKVPTLVTPELPKQRSPIPVPSGMSRSQTTPMPLNNLLSGAGPAAVSGHGRTVSIPTSPVTNASKRSHLVREIVTTERSYANDLALIRDAYLLRYIRPGSQVSTVDSTAAPSETSRRSSIYTYQTAETKRSSGHDLSLLVPSQKSPAQELGAGGNSYMTASASTSSFAGMAQAQAQSQAPGKATSSRNASGSSLAGSMAPPVGKPLSPADVRTVFLNLDQLAAAAEELATAFEGAMGTDASPAVGREGETGNDRLGEVFVSYVQRFRTLYNFYCARQATASTRLRELLADSAHAMSLNDCWSHVKPHTHAWDLDSMLIKPVQRITKYPLLFDDLLACTTPVHADYFNIRNAAVMARSVAQEIDETKRRKDVVAGVISKNGSKLLGSGDRSKSSGGGGGGGLKLFRKEKSTSAVPTTSSTTLAHQASMSTLDTGVVAEITKASLTHFKELVNRVDQCEQCVRRAGKEIILWTAAAKDVFMIQDGLIKAWLGLVTLDGQEGPDPKLIWFRKVIAGIVSDAWRTLNDEVQDQIVPALSKLLESGVNPRKVIAKRDLKAPDYARYFSLTEAKKPVDRSILQSAKDFVALHTQLVEELPPFLEGYMRIFDLAMCAFAQSQASYHYRVRERIGEYVAQYLDGIKRSPVITQSQSGSRTGNQQQPQQRESGLDNRSIAGIVRNWSDGWSPYADAVDRFQCTKPARQAATRIASFQDRPGSHTRQNSGHSQTGSRSGSPMPPISPSRPNTSTFRRDKRSDNQRRRSTSLMGPPPLPSPSKEKTGFFGLSRSSKSPNTNSSSMSKSATATSPMKDIPRLRSPSPLDPSVRNSFGLPTISPDSGKFGGLSALGRSGSQRSHSRNGSTSSLVSNPGLGFGFTSTAPPGSSGVSELLDRAYSQQNRSRKSSTSSRSDRRRKTQSMVSAMDVMAPRVAVIKPEDVDAAAGWRGEKVLYQCACVAAFPDRFGRRKYRGLEFLSMTVGDLFDILHEVGRIDELPSFPYPEVGVDNDGVLVAQGETGEIGLVICSFLEPLT